MSNPLVQSFFIGRALAEVMAKQAETAFSNGMSELGKFDAEQRERLRQFVEEVLDKARQDEAQAMSDRPQASSSAPSSAPASTDLQTTIDELRAEIAELRSELQRYRSRTR